MTRLTNRLVLVKFRLALSNRSSSCFSVLNARMTGSPVRISRVTRLSLSTSFCMRLNFGMATANSTSTIAMIASTATPMIQAIDELVFITLITPPTPMMGA